ncbi:hypothetical protein GCM10025867_46240 (plasmid) [Frondihabitans sucicola]|uniref:Septum formation-related domain-containing protein n=1 Tax=Frondihabitans sucicola TaxID=1268041 RepID=A0ABM8GV92_9MICO|nr:septum formation family protein [Frondihabitans sucicola]BDZ52383.1 hypothetical protein GCM10025867_46240 [Frondihabitans sucicola]
MLLQSGGFMKKSIVAALAATLALTAALAGCSSPTVSATPGPGTVSTPSAAPTVTVSGDKVVPKTGDCWSLSKADQAVWTTWDGWEGTAPVSCSGTHQLVTTAVATIPTSLASTYPGPRTSKWSAALATWANATCVAPNVAAQGGSQVASMALLTAYASAPSEAMWKAGHRILRCDLGLIAEGTLAAPVLGSMPASLAAIKTAAKADPKKYALCVVATGDPSTTGPLADPTAAKIVPCTGTSAAYWRDALLVDLGKTFATYPGEAALDAKMKTICPSVATSGEAWWEYGVAESTYPSYKYGACWVFNS